MRVIKKIIEHLDNTLDEANEYYTDYVMYKDEYPKVSMTALEMAKVHLDLYSKWHQVIVSLINDYKVTSGEPPKEMMTIWNYEHEKLIEHYEDLKSKINSATR